MYKVIKSFTDLQDDNHLYQVGDTFPREGKEVTEVRLQELSSTANKQRVPLIEEDVLLIEEEKPKKKRTRKKKVDKE